MTPVCHQALVSDGIRHGFFTRTGGVSQGIYASANSGPGSDDDPAAVAENRARVAQALAVAPDNLLTCHQIHSPDVVTVTEPFADRPRADALVTRAPGLVLGVLTADCAPVLFADAQAGVIGAAHAGWKGALGGVLANTVAAMAALGADPARIVAVVGPCIAQPSYEVGTDFRARFVEADPTHGAFFLPGVADDKCQFDLPGFVCAQLTQAGVGRVAAVGRDTYAEAADFFSYRRTCHAGEPDYGRQISAIVLGSPGSGPDL